VQPGRLPTLGVGGQNGTPLPAPNADVTTIGLPASTGTTPTTTVPVSTTPTAPVTIAQGARASFQLSYANLCTHVLEPGQPATGVPNECYTGIWLEVTPTAGSGPLIVTEPLRLTYATAGFEVGPFQAGDGVPLAGPPPLTAQTTVPSVPATTRKGGHRRRSTRRLAPTGRSLLGHRLASGSPLGRRLLGRSPLGHGLAGRSLLGGALLTGALRATAVFTAGAAVFRRRARRRR